MAVREVRRIGDPVLRLPAKRVEEFGEQWLPFLEDMYDTCVAEEGAGLAAPQIGQSLQIAVVFLRKEQDEPFKIAVFNPEIIYSEGECVFEEGCLSIPGIREEVSRPQKIRLRFQDYTGKPQEIEADEVLARVLQHEIDHLNGVLFVDHLSGVKRALLKGKLESISAGEEVE